MQSWDEERLPYLGRERELLREAVDEGVPVLGICLGGQLLARALGAEGVSGRASGDGLARDRGDAGGRRRPAARPSARAGRRLPVASRRLRPAGRRRSPGTQRAEREPGVPLRRARLGPAVPPRGGRPVVRGLDAELRGCARAHGARSGGARGRDRGRLAASSPSRCSARSARSASPPRADGLVSCGGRARASRSAGATRPACTPPWRRARPRSATRARVRLRCVMATTPLPDCFLL